MTISLRNGEYGYTSFNDNEVSVYLDDDKFVDWLDMNWEYISQAVEDFCYNDAWCCGGVFEVELDILQIYQNASRCLKIRSRINFLDLFFCLFG